MTELALAFLFGCLVMGALVFVLVEILQYIADKEENGTGNN